MGLGFQGAFGASAASDTLADMIARRRKQEMDALGLKQRTVEGLNQQDLQEREFADRQAQEAEANRRADLQTEALTGLRSQQEAQIAAGLREKEEGRKRKEDAITKLLSDPSIPDATKAIISASAASGGDIPWSEALKAPPLTPAQKLQQVTDEAIARAKAEKEYGYHAPPSPASFGFVTATDPATGELRVQAINRRDPSNRIPIGGAAPTGAQRGQLSESEAATSGLGRMEALYKPEYVGPLAGRLKPAQLATVGGDPDQAEFYAEAAAIKNRVIKAITGAQMSEPEAARIIQQIPVVTDTPVNFKAKLAATRKNYDDLQKAILGTKARAIQAGEGAGAGAGAGAGGNVIRVDVNGNPI